MLYYERNTMKLKCLGRLSLFVAVVQLIVPETAHAQRPGARVPVVSVDTYEKVLDLVFPRSAVAAEGLVRSFAIRYEPTWKAESQIIITQRKESIEVVEYVSVDGSIYLKLEDILRRTGQENAP